MKRLSWISPVVVMCVAFLILVPIQAFSIVNGTLDLTTECVGSLHEIYALGFVCTGTLIHESWVLTAAQCAVVKPNVWAMGPDWSSGPRAYWADYVVIHPLYSAPGVFDIALVHLAAPVPLEPVCSPLSPGEDTLSVGSTINHVGYGLTG